MSQPEVTTKNNMRLTCQSTTIASRGGSSVGAGGAGAPYPHAIHWSPPKPPLQFLAMNEEEEEKKVKKEEGKARKKEEDGKLSPPFTSILDPPLTRNASLILFGSSGRLKT